MSGCVSENKVTSGSDLSYGRYGGMVQEYYIREFRDISSEREKRLAKIQTREDAEEYVREVREKLHSSFGKFPEKTPLNARITGQTETENLLIDKVVFESRPGLEVTGLFYRLKGSSKKRPGILTLCGHSRDGKGAPWYQNLAQSLALRGYGVLMIDPIGQGERGISTAEPGIYHSPVAAHNMLGKSLHLLGENLSMWRLWDAIRGIDYLLSRPEIDSRHIGVTGTSGGGTMSTFLNAFESRLTMAAPSCYVTTQRHNLENEIPADSEQNPPHFLKLGLDTADFIIAAAPRPVTILAQDNDFFDPRGTREAFDQARKIYALLGKPENLKLYVGHGDHGYSAEHRQACGRFFNSLTGFTTDWEEPETHQPFPKEQICCLKNGQMAGNQAFGILRKMLENCPLENSLAKEELRKKFAGLLQIEMPEGAPHYRMLRPEVHVVNQKDWHKEKFLNRFGLETEPGIMAVCKQFSELNDLSYYPKFKEEAILFIPHLTASRELLEMPLTGNAHRDLMALEVRGIGETRPMETSLWEKNFFADYGSDFLYAACGFMLDRSYLGRKVYDVLAAIQFMKKFGVKKIQLAGNGQGAVVAALAALYEPAVVNVTLYHAPSSWKSIVMKGNTAWPYSVIPYGVLQECDLPQVYQAIGAKLIDVRDEPLEDPARQ